MDLIDVTVETWTRALWRRLDWDEARDVPRLVQAFLALAGNSAFWPAPTHCVEALPRVDVPRSRALNYSRERDPSVRVCAVRNITEILRHVHINKKEDSCN